MAADVADVALAKHSLNRWQMRFPRTTQQHNSQGLSANQGVSLKLMHCLQAPRGSHRGPGPLTPRVSCVSPTASICSAARARAAREPPPLGAACVCVFTPVTLTITRRKRCQLYHPQFRGKQGPAQTEPLAQSHTAGKGRARLPAISSAFQHMHGPQPHPDGDPSIGAAPGQ